MPQKSCYSAGYGFERLSATKAWHFGLPPMKKGLSRQGKRGLFVTFEGGEGAGKSTQIDLLAQALQKQGEQTLATREPGGSPGAEAVRHVLLSGAAEPLGAEAEAMLFAAARADHVDTVIRPALDRGQTVLCDRFYDSTRVYQGAQGRVSMALLYRLEAVACGDCRPDLTLILDIDPAEGLRRAAARRRGHEIPDRFEKEDLSLQKYRRGAYLAIASEEPDRCRVIDAARPRQAVHQDVLRLVLEKLAEPRRPLGGAGEIAAQS